MRWLIVIIILVGLNRVSAQIVNGTFDDWEIISLFGQPYENPVHWKTNNDNDPFGFANTPVTKGTDSLGFYARIESNYRGIDALLPGKLSQTISARNLDRINYRYKCDSIFQSGRCIVNILGDEQESVLFTDSLSIEDSEFNEGGVDILKEWVMLNDSLTIQFVAKGNLDMWDKEEDGHSIFLIDNVVSVYVTNIDEEKRILKSKIFPNPTPGKFNILTNRDLHFNILEIYTMAGIKIYTDKYADSIDLSWVPNGSYIMRLTSDGETIIENIIIHR